MDNYLQQIKVAKMKKALDDFTFLLQEGNIAFYKSCEISQIFLFNTTNNTVINYFTLFCFSELEKISETVLKLGITKINKNIKVGCQRKTVPIEQAKKCFTEIQQGILNYDEEIKIPKDLYLLPKVLISKQVINDVFIKDLIKPNYWGDSYIIEFYDENKTQITNIKLENEMIEKINCFTSDKLQIDLSRPYDRIGNIIFQFPITVQYSIIESQKNSVSHRFKLSSHPKLKSPNTYQIQMYSKLDNVITGFDTVERNGFDVDVEICPGDDNNLCIVVIDKSKSLLLNKSEVNFLRSFNINGRIGMQYSEPRVIKDRYGKQEEIELFSSTNMGYSGEKENDYFSRIIKRNINNKVIIQSGDCAVFKKNQRSEALRYIRDKVMNLSNIKEICLWDPYLSAFDIMETIYFENTGIPFRCITEFKHSKKIENDGTYSEEKNFSFKEYCREQKQCFINNSNNLRVKMKFLAQHDIYGWQFHDRFLILVPKNISDLPIIYSLGISINQIGESHHTIQKVPDPRKILANFDELWKLLDNGNCLVAEF